MKPSSKPSPSNKTVAHVSAVILALVILFSIFNSPSSEVLPLPTTATADSTVDSSSLPSPLAEPQRHIAPHQQLAAAPTGTPQLIRRLPKPTNRPTITPPNRPPKSPVSEPLTFTPLPPVEFDTSEASNMLAAVEAEPFDKVHKVQPVDRPEFIQQATFASPVIEPSSSTEPVATSAQPPKPVGPNLLAGWESELPQDAHSILVSQAEEKPTDDLDAADSDYYGELKNGLNNEPDDGRNIELDNELDELESSFEESFFDTPDQYDNQTDVPTQRSQELQATAANDASESFADDPAINIADDSAFETEMLFENIRNQRVTAAEREIRWSLNDAIMASLVYSNRISSLKIESIEELQNVGVQTGRFDVVGFIDQSFRNSSEPVGTTFETASAGQRVVQEEDLNVAYGLRKQLVSGGQVELNQSYQIRDNDSGILVPEDQAFSRFNARVTKELLRGAGRSIALNEVLVAYHDASAQQAESVSEIANHLNDVMTAYWDIFAARGALFAGIENRRLAIEVLNELQARKEIDAERNLLDQARATIRQRELTITNAHNDLIQSQIRLISLVNAPELLANRNSIEILPQVAPDLQLHQLDIDSRLSTAIQRRPEVADAIEQIKSAQVTNHFSLNELLPRLSAFVDAGINGLAGDRQLGLAVENQFDNDVTYEVGFNFEVPFANRQARFTKRRSELVVSRLKADWKNTIELVKADVLNNAQEFTTSQTRLEKQKDILKFSGSELRYLGIRKTLAPKANSNPSFALTQVLAAQDRQGAARAQFIAAIADKHRAIFELNRATGILINPNVIPQDGGPARPGLFSVYHQYIEDSPKFECPAAELEWATRVQAREAKQARRRQRSGVEQLLLPAWDQSSATQSNYGSNEITDAPQSNPWAGYISDEAYVPADAQTNWSLPVQPPPVQIQPQIQSQVQSHSYPLE